MTRHHPRGSLLVHMSDAFVTIYTRDDEDIILEDLEVIVYRVLVYRALYVRREANVREIRW